MIDTVTAGLADELPDVCAVIDGAGIVRYVSPSIERVLGVTTRRAVGQPACDLVAIDERRRCASWLRQVLAGADDTELNHRVLRADATTAWFETRARRVGPDENPLAVTVSRDVTERAEVDQQLGLLSRMWSDVCDLVREGVVVLDDDGMVVAANRGAVALLENGSGLLGTHIGGHVGLVGPADEPQPVDVETLRRRTGTAVELTVLPDTAGHRRLAGRPAVLSPTVDLPFERLVLVVEPADGGTPPAAGVLASSEDRSSPARGTLSPREVEVLTMLTHGLDVHGISHALGISVHTTRAYVKSLLRKLDASTQLQAVVVALRTGLVALS